jgi:choline dehydrogenase-like flavoprotein
VELNALTAPEGLTLDAEVCIVGAGPAGISLAHALQARGIQCALIESGGYPPGAESQELNLAETSGDLHQDLRLARARGAGGTAALWNTMFRGARFAKYLPLDPIDFEVREWIPWSGWPFGRIALESCYHRAQAVCGLGPFDYGGRAWSDLSAPLLSRGSGSLVQSVYHYGPADRFTVALPAKLAASSSVTWLHGATVTGLEATANGDRIIAVRWAALCGIEGRVRAARFVLAAGAIENARLLLAHAPAANGDGWLGRGFMEHPVDASLELSSRDPALAATPGFFGAREAGRGIVVGRIGLSADLLRSESLPNASLRLLRESEPVLMRSPGFRSVARRLVPFPAWRRRIGDAIRRRSGRIPPGGATRHRVLLDLEQPPHRENRIRLSDQRDRLGQQRAVVDWRWRGGDEAGRQRIREVFARELERGGAGRLQVSRETALDPAIHHHAGTTRMHPDPALGVVDGELRVHRMENLYVTGASVFPTAGVANPTLTVVALSLRLADHLSGSSRKKIASTG